MSPAAWLLFPLIGYLLGSLPWAVWLVRWRTGEDIRAFGSGHAGTTNVYRRLGPWWALAVLLLDVGKGFAAVAWARHGGAPPAVVGLTGAAAVAGHNWPLWARFRGGMGNATTLGALLAASPLAALVALGWLVLWVLVWHHAARGTLVAALTAGALFSALPLPADARALAWAIGPVLGVRFAQDWHRRYRELWLDRPHRHHLRPRAPRTVTRAPHVLLEAAYAALLLWAGVRLLAPLEQVFDIGLFDETRYLMRGLHLQWAELPRLYRAPLYAVWYAFLAQWQPDPVALYDLNVRVQALALPLLLYGLLRTLKWSRPAAFGVAWFVLLSDANLLPWPRASTLAWLIVLLGLGLYLRLADGGTARAAMLSALWLSAFIRPEMLLAVALAGGEMLWFVHRNRLPRARRVRLAGGLAALALLTVVAMGSPLREGERLQAAFLQHFAYRWNARYGMPGGTWSRWRETGQQIFGTDGSLLRLVAGNPRAFGHHLAVNLAEAGPKTAMLLFFHVPISGTVWHEGGLAMVGWALIGAAALWRRPRALLQTQRRLLWAAALLVLPGLVSALVIYPRRHYLLGVALMAWLLWAAQVRAIWRARAPQASHDGSLHAWLGLVLALALVALTPPVTARFPCPDQAPRLAGKPLPRHTQWLCRTTDTREAIHALRAAAQQRAPLTVAIDPNFWEENLEVYLPATVQRTHDAPGTPEKLLLLPTDVVLLPYGRPWLDHAARRAALETVRQRGGRVGCTSGRPWVLVFRDALDVPLSPCP